MQIKKHILYENGQPVKYISTPNTSGVLKPVYLIVHYDAAPNNTSAINWMTNPASKVSAHLHIDRVGNIVQLVPFNVVAWHAGKSNWNGKSDLNWLSIGVELQNTGSQDYTHEQIEALTRVSKLLVEWYDLKEILGHSDVSPGRKIDPGKQFPMECLRERVYNNKC